MRYQLKSPAKLNLSLEVLGKRPDGYHEIKSLMIPINQFDNITLNLDESDALECRCNHPGVPTGPENLACRAVKAFMEASGERFGARIDIKKNIPVGAGLGGGSSNAGIVLKELNRVKREPLNHDKLMEVAASIGSDVPFFMKTGAQWATGRGEKLTSGPKLPPWTYVVVFPGFEVSAGWAYTNSRLTPHNKNSIVVSFKVGGVNLVNHLEAAVLEAYPKVGKLKERLLAVGARAALMTGSGPSVFGIFENSTAANEAIRKFGDHPDTTVFLAQELMSAT